MLRASSRTPNEGGAAGFSLGAAAPGGADGPAGHRLPTGNTWSASSVSRPLAGQGIGPCVPGSELIPADIAGLMALLVPSPPAGPACRSA
jgi:hypothetical protein